MSNRTFRPGGIHPPEMKLTAGYPIVDTELPRKVTLLMSQHIGAPAKCVVKKGDHVAMGDVVAEAGGFVSANVHATISGTVTKLDRVRNPQGQPCDAVVIESTDDDHRDDLQRFADLSPRMTVDEALALDPAEIVRIIGDAGIVGLGGATFPTRVKLSPPPGMTAEVLIINGAECEPFLTNDDAIMREQSEAIVDGVRLLARAAKVTRSIIGIEDNKPEAIAAMTQAASRYPEIEVMPLQVKYPEGSEKQLIQATIGKEVPSGALPIATGAVVQNVATALATRDAVIFGLPLIQRVMTITGPKVAKPGNYRVTIGSDISTLIEMAGGVPAETGKIIIGGPMMGRAASTIDAPTTKGTSAILILPADESRRRVVEPCIRCAACVNACPMGLEPYLLATLSRLEMWDEVAANKAMNCVECGSCSYSCPSSRPILDYIRLGKIKLRSRK